MTPTPAERKLFVATFKGHYIGGDAVVFAPDVPAAKRLIKTRAKESGLDLVAADINVTEADPKQNVVHFYDGDY